MQTLYVPKYGITYRVNQKNPRELLWSVKPFGPATQWQHAYTFSKPIRALDTDDQTGQGVVVLNDSTTYVGSGVRVWGKKFYTAGSRIYSLYAIGESKMTNKMKIKIKERRRMQEPPVEPKVDVEEFVKDVLGKHNFLIDPNCYSDVRALVGYKEMFSGVERPLKLTLFIQYDHDLRNIYVALLNGSYRMATRACQVKPEFFTGLFSNWGRISEQNAERYIAAAEKAAEFYCQALQAMDTP